MKSLLLGLALLSPWSPVVAQDDAAQPAPAYVHMQTSLGDLLLELDRARAPKTVANFLSYVEKGHYTGTIFHRVIKDFMAQGGGFNTDLVQKPTDPPVVNEADNGLLNIKGSLAMARTGDPHSATAQFFINTVDNAFLNHKSKTQSGWGYTVFGRLVGGLDTLEKIRNVETRQHPKFGREVAFPVEQVVIEKASQVDAEDLAAVRERMASAAANAAKQRMAAASAATAEGVRFVGSQGHDVEQGSHSDSGLWTFDEVKGSGAFPRPDDPVTIHYTGWLADGTQFDTSHGKEDGAPTHPLNRFIEGWKEGLGGMQPGGVRWMVIPPELAYGAAGRGDTIPPNATLVFKVELLDIKAFDSHDDAMEFIQGQGVDTSGGVFTDSGLWMLDVAKGEGNTATPESKVTVHYTGWLTDGTKFDSSRDRGQPMEFGLRQVIKGWTEGVSGMAPGGRRWLVIPYDIAYGVGGRPPTIPPKATLIFDIELLSM